MYEFSAAILYIQYMFCYYVISQAGKSNKEIYIFFKWDATHGFDYVADAEHHHPKTADATDSAKVYVVWIRYKAA